ncbi:hypothetical protein DLAC_09105 [Tieghemostelium lacteum]|uniref:Uncharacterized protein n=1 Tax=Tieghemostelium lacteum TaxID=361077 RepID=A0A151Z950_TIELA|nr:hypothetical protein DLAC_09105 [Tieghemostelium lacteum]|eukprot:KYQ90480.1 hypothetical protein DLAC_09105 [Tieghemostelium lacteum]
MEAITNNTELGKEIEEYKIKDRELFKKASKLKERLSERFSYVEKEIDFAVTVRITVLFHYYLEFTLLPLYNRTYNTAHTYEQFKEHYVCDAQRIAGTLRLDRIRDFFRDRNLDLQYNTATFESRVDEYVEAVKNTYNSNTKIQMSLRKMYDTLESVIQQVTGDKTFIL